ncbi:hypothetical protein [Dokdonella immobilis]|uniref:Uncharacterized protein n=1 Tax=Dokdonella immobilis TaxID=578942 RepID=A0A1I4YKV0_9GAMM|nr:hypothetical protein [Dokdonella immobilis]SFN38685.1 hypothetical protein SAMN05216289_11832 [Dokdonella immobilis]
MRLRNVLLLAVVVLAGGALALEFAARSAALRVARALAPRAVLTYDSAGIALDGSVRLREPRLEVRQGRWQGELKARSADLRGSGRFWLVGQSLSRDPDPPSDLSLVVHGLTINGSDGGNGVGSWLGTPDLALFENQGCGSDNLGEKDRARMGIAASPRVDRFEYHHDAASKTIELMFELDSPNVANWQGYAEFSAFDPGRWSDSAARHELRLVRAGLSYRDPGYLSRRNTFCAQWLGVSSTEFVDRHVEAVRSFLVSRGINPSAEVLALYQRLVTRGGALNLASIPEASWVPAELEAYPRQLLLRQLNITARLDDAPPIMLRLAFAEPEIPLYVVKSADRLASAAVPELALGPGAEVAAVAAAPTPPRPATETVEPPGPEAATEPVVAKTVSAAPAPGPPPAYPEPRAENDEAKPARLDSSGKVIASAPPPPPDSTLALVWEPGVIERLPPAQTKQPEYEVVTVASLGRYIGKRFQLVTVNGKRVEGEIDSVEPDRIVLLVQVGRGSAKLNVPVSNIREARLLRPR